MNIFDHPLGTLSSPAEWEVSARSETGYIREENQDRMSGIQVQAGRVYIVADGMGGHKGGALAAELTVQSLQQHLSQALPQMPVEEAVRRAFEKANLAVYEQAHSGNPETEGMGSTAVVLLALDSVARVAHVGDSRAYLYRQGRLQPLTTDHSRVQRMVDAGVLTSEEAHGHPEANLLERAIGQKPQIEVDIGPDLQLKQGDGILLCSDGLCGYVRDQEIETVLRSDIPVQQVAGRLVDLALAKGGHDNVTVQFIQYGRRRGARHGYKRFYRSPAVIIVIAMALLAGLALYRTLYYKEERPAPSPISQQASTQKENKSKGAQSENAQGNKSTRVYSQEVKGQTEKPK